jgi:hypothetical protein
MKFFRYVIFYNKAYLTFDKITSTATTYIKGRGFIKNNPFKSSNTGIYVDSQLESDIFQIFDTPEYVIPPNENEGVFIMTNFIKTSQTISNCDEWLGTPGAECYTDEDCIKKKDNYNNLWHGN